MATHAVLIVDKSGSMERVRDDVIGGINSYLDDLEGDIKVSLLLFDTSFKVVCKDKRPNKVKRFTREVYSPRGGTALYDAVGKTLEELEFPEGDKVLCVIQTDGEENSSREFTAEGVKNLVLKREKEGWDFIYLGADDEAWSESAKIGIGTLKTFYSKMDSGFAVNTMYSGVAAATNTYQYAADRGEDNPLLAATSTYASATAPITTAWSDK